MAVTLDRVWIGVWVYWSLVHITRNYTLQITDTQWRLVAKISGGAAPENCILFINWVMATDIKLKDYILYKYKERIKEKKKRTNCIICYR
jgi:hypothetical protein